VFCSRMALWFLPRPERSRPRINILEGDYRFVGRIASTKCGQLRSVIPDVCQSVCHVLSLCKRGWTDRGPVWDGQYLGPKEHCIRLKRHRNACMLCTIRHYDNSFLMPKFAVLNFGVHSPQTIALFVSFPLSTAKIWPVISNCILQTVRDRM